SEVNSGALSLISMSISPDRSRLYSKGAPSRQAGTTPKRGGGITAYMLQNSRRALRVILLVCCSASFLYAQVAKKRTVSIGPRAVAVLQIAENGQAHLIP